MTLPDSGGLAISYFPTDYRLICFQFCSAASPLDRKSHLEFTPVASAPSLLLLFDATICIPFLAGCMVFSEGAGRTDLL